MVTVGNWHSSLSLTVQDASNLPSETCGPPLIAPGTPTHEPASEDCIQEELGARLSEGMQNGLADLTLFAE